MKEPYTFHFDEAVALVPAGFEDKSVQILRWPLPGEDGVIPEILLVFMRRPLQLPFEEAVRKDVADTRAGLKSCAIERDEPARLRDVPAHLLTMRYVRDKSAIYHRQVFVHLPEKLLTIFTTGPAAHREAVDELFATTIDGLKFRE